MLVYYGTSYRWITYPIFLINGALLTSHIQVQARIVVSFIADHCHGSGDRMGGARDQSPRTSLRPSGSSSSP